MEKKKCGWKEAHVRPGWKRHTTYFDVTTLKKVMSYAKKNQLKIMDVIDDAIRSYLKLS